MRLSLTFNIKRAIVNHVDSQLNNQKGICSMISISGLSSVKISQVGVEAVMDIRDCLFSHADEEGYETLGYHSVDSDEQAASKPVFVLTKHVDARGSRKISKILGLDIKKFDILMIHAH
jgi:hypothetical protein